jgi:hypothetical protein
MGIYLFCVCLGFTGLAAMALLGHFSGFGHHGHAHGHGHAPVSSGHGHHWGGKWHLHSPGDIHGHSSGDGDADSSSKYWLWFSPRVLFSLLFAFGVSGFFLEHLLPAALVVIIALAAAILFERLLVQPIWRLLFGFASNPARTLDHAVLEEAEAVTAFDRQGHGVVAVNLDGQRVQLLARLSEAARRSQQAIHAGDRLSIIAVDTRRNRCTVTPIPISAQSISSN